MEAIYCKNMSTVISQNLDYNFLIKTLYHTVLRIIYAFYQSVKYFYKWFQFY